MICSLLDSGSKPSLEIPDSESYRIFALVDWKTLKSSRLLNGKELPFPTDLAFLKLLMLFWKALSPRDKGQIISERNFGLLNFPKTNEIFVRISALVVRIKIKINANLLAYSAFIYPILEAKAEILTKISLVFLENFRQLNFFLKLHDL